MFFRYKAYTYGYMVGVYMPKIVTTEQIREILGLDRETVANYYNAYIGWYREWMKLLNQFVKENMVGHIQDAIKLKEHNKALDAEIETKLGLVKTLEGMAQVLMKCRNCGITHLTEIKVRGFIERVPNNEHWEMVCPNCGLKTVHTSVEEEMINKLKLEILERSRQIRQPLF